MQNSLKGKNRAPKLHSYELILNLLTKNQPGKLLFFIVLTDTTQQ